MSNLKNIMLASLILATGLSAWQIIAPPPPETQDLADEDRVIPIALDAHKFFKNCYLTPMDSIKWPLYACKLEKKECNHILVEIDIISKYTAEEQTQILQIRNNVPVGTVEVRACTGVYL